MCLCLFRFMVLRTSYAIRVASSFRLIALRTSYVFGVTRAVYLFWLMARLDFLRFHRNRCVSNGSDGLCRTTFQPSSKYCLHFWFHLMTKLPVTQVDSTVLPVSFFDRTPSVSRFCPLESGREYWTWVSFSGRLWLRKSGLPFCVSSFFSVAWKRISAQEHY